MRASVRSALIFAVAALAALQVAQPVSGHLVDREVFENVTPTLYDYSRRDAAATAVPSSTSSTAGPATATPGTGCKANSDCATGSCSAGKCVPQIGTGVKNSFCDSDAQCTASSYCYRGSCQEIKQTGSNCYKDSGCTSGSCINKKCINNASQKNGFTCTRSDQCVNGSFCSNGKCNTVQPANSYCYKNQGCTSGICVNNKCSSKGLAKLGQYCTASNKCQSNFCFKNACRAKRARNQPCSQNETCISNRCRNNRTCA